MGNDGARFTVYQIQCVLHTYIILSLESIYKFMSMYMEILKIKNHLNFISNILKAVLNSKRPKNIYGRNPSAKRG